VTWKAEIQLLDLDHKDRLEACCKKCGYTWYELPEGYFHKPYIAQLFLDEFEAKLGCKQWNCKGEIRIALSNEAETEGFQGGLT